MGDRDGGTTSRTPPIGALRAVADMEPVALRMAKHDDAEVGTLRGSEQGDRP